MKLLFFVPVMMTSDISATSLLVPTTFTSLG